MDYRSTLDQRYSSDKGTNLLELFEEDDSVDEDVPELVQVYLRLKPSNVPSSLYEVRGDQCLITSVDTATAGHGRRTQHNVSKMYSFSHIFGPEANQKEIFEHVVKGNLRRLRDGNNFTLLTYGASGSGKTYTLMGTVKAPGLVPRSLEYVFNIVDAAQMPLYRPGEVRANKLSMAEQEHELQWVRHLRHVSAPLRDKYRRMSTRLCNDMTRSTCDLTNRTKHYVWVSFVEIYNEAIYDLLVTTERTAASKLRIREDPSGNAYVKGATQAFVRTGEEAYDVMVAGKHNLQVHATGVHAHSSRSHCIFTITMLTVTESGVRASHVRLCDLAGSERVCRTRNTGARMQESRSINSSLHVLERCLHTLRRKQTTKLDLVPYRESKLTRLLGSGLSGTRGEAVSMVVTLNPSPEYAHETRHVLQLAAVARDIRSGLSGTRGEAVSMVVTLNPSPEYAHETRHVLQLAAVARDIQVNNTIAETVSTLESSYSQDETIASSAEVTRLRADNERLHYELVQAESLNRKLMAEMAEQRQDNAVTMRELVEEARDITQQYYKQQIRSLEERREREIADLREEYEAKLAKAVVSDEGTPSRALQNKVVQLTKQIAILEEELNAERLARARMNEEMLHLRACIEERDLAANDNSNDDAIQLTDSEDDSDEADDLCNDSLEPTFKKEEINRSRLMRQSSVLNNTKNTTFEMDKIHDMHKDDTWTGIDATHDVSNNDSYNLSTDCPATVKKADLNKDSMSAKEGKPDDLEGSKEEFKQSARETYFVSNSNITKFNISGHATKTDSIETNDTGNFADISVSLKEDDDFKDVSIIGDINFVKTVKPFETQIDKIKRFAKSTVSDSSLAEFEMIEIDVSDVNKDGKSAFKYFDDGTDKKTVSVSPRYKEKKTYFDDKQPSPHQTSMLKDLMKHDPSIVQDEIPENYKPTSINKIMRESFTVSTEIPPSPYKNKRLLKMYDSIDPFEEVDSPCPNKQDVFKSVEKVRKSIEKVSLADTDMELKTEIMKGVVHTEDATLPEEDRHSDVMDLNVPSPPKQNKTNRQSKSETSEKVNSDIDVKLDNLTKVKQQQTNSENAVNDTEKELKPEQLTHEISSLNYVTNSNQTIASDASDNNTIDAFDKIYKDITVPNTTDFELVVCDKTKDTANEVTNKIEEAIKKVVSYEKNIKQNIESVNKDISCDEDNNSHEMKAEIEFKEVPETNKVPTKYNLRHKNQDTSKTDNEHETTVEHTEKHAPRTAKKSLRLRKRNKLVERVEDEVKLKDIVNLQNEFSDVTMGVPAPVKVVTDIPSPEETDTENLPPMMGVQSCPSKSVSRSRRKLYTPHAEPLEESPPAGDSGERVRVPRPSYHRHRTRRRL